MNITDIISQQINASVVDSVNNSNVLMERLFGKTPHTHKSMPWTPIRYTSLRLWFFMNYAIIVLLGVLVACIAYLVVTMV